VNFIEDRVTPLPVDELIGGMIGGYETNMGEGARPSSKLLACLVAQACLETGNGVHLHCYNLGNVKAARDWEGLACQYRCNEIIEGKVKWFDPPHPQTWFRAFLSAADGCAEFVGFLANRDRYRKAWDRAVAGDPSGFVLALGAAGYFTANVETYRRAVASIANRVELACARALDAERHEFTAADIEEIDGLVGVTLRESLLGRYQHSEDRYAA
jgi:hypothetical protein